jgi:uncharacterized membrane protein YbhN (UPF0104 family)
MRSFEHLTVPNRKVKAGAQLLAKSSVTIAVLWIAARHIDLHAFTGDLRGLHPYWLWMALIQLLLIPPLGGVRWWVVLNGLGNALRIALLTRIFWIGMVFNQVLPSASGGDAVRVLLAWRAGLPLAASIHSVILERIALLLTLAGTVAAFQPILLDRTNLPGARLLPPMLLAGGIAGLAFLLFADGILRRLPSWGAVNAVSRFSFDVRKTFLTRSGLYLVAVCVLTNLNLSLFSLWLGKSLDLSLSLIDYIVFIPIVTLITTLPISIGGWGIREGATVLLFGSLGVSSHGALAFSVLFGMSIAIVSLPGLPFLWLDRAPLRRSRPVGPEC